MPLAVAADRLEQAVHEWRKAAGESKWSSVDDARTHDEQRYKARRDQPSLTSSVIVPSPEFKTAGILNVIGLAVLTEWQEHRRLQEGATMTFQAY